LCLLLEKESLNPFLQDVDKPLAVEHPAMEQIQHQNITMKSSP
jgi:hypothetical protein